MSLDDFQTRQRLALSERFIAHAAALRRLVAVVRPDCELIEADRGTFEKYDERAVAWSAYPALLGWVRAFEKLAAQLKVDPGSAEWGKPEVPEHVESDYVIEEPSPPIGPDEVWP